MEKAKLSYLQVTEGKWQVIYSSSFSPSVVVGMWNYLWTWCFSRVRKPNGLLDLRPPEVLSNLNYPRALWFCDPAFLRTRQGRLSPELSHGALRLLPLPYFDHGVCEHWRSLDGVLAPWKAALYIKVKGLPLTKVHPPKCLLVFLLVIPQVSAEGEATGQKAQMKICMAP